MRKRLVIVGIDDICRLFRDYARMTGFPEDAQCDTLLFHPPSRRMRLRVASALLGDHEPPEEIRFDLRRTYMVS